MKKLEELRAAGGIGSSLQAEVEVHATGETYDALASLDDDLRFVWITSGARVVRVACADDQSIDVHASDDTKCARCWHWRDDVGADPAHPAICGRCVSNLYGEGEARRFA